MDSENILLMIPGPVPVTPRIMRAMTQPMVGHRSEDFVKVTRDLRGLMQYTLQTAYDVALLSGTGSAGMEAAIANLAVKGDKVLTIVNGKFGERFHELAEVYAEPCLFAVKWGTAPDLEKLEKTIAEEKPKLVTVVHNETSTGLTNPVAEIGAIAKKHGALFIVDGVTSVGGIDLKPEAIGADIVIVGSQKGLGIPPGLCVVAVSPDARKQLRKDTSYYLNLEKHIESMEKAKPETPYTPPISLFYGLHESLSMLKEEGIENRIAHIGRLAEASRAAVKAMGLKLYADETYASNTVTAIEYPDGVDDAAFRKALRKDFRIVIAGGQAELSGKIFRIAHMGNCDWKDLIATYAAVEVVLKKMGHDVAPGSAVGAIEQHM